MRVAVILIFILAFNFQAIAEEYSFNEFVADKKYISEPENCFNDDYFKKTNKVYNHAVDSLNSSKTYYSKETQQSPAVYGHDQLESRFSVHSNTLQLLQIDNDILRCKIGQLQKALIDHLVQEKHQGQN